MATRLTPFGWLVKFLIVPVVVAAIGYFFLGPRLNRTGKALAELTGHKVTIAPAEAAPATVDGGPSVDVQVHGTSVSDATPVPPEPTHRRSRRRRRKSSSPPVTPSTDEASAPVNNPPSADGGGSGGATTAGETPP